MWAEPLDRRIPCLTPRRTRPNLSDAEACDVDCGSAGRVWVVVDGDGS
jgi:hypothetical protein